MAVPRTQRQGTQPSRPTGPLQTVMTFRTGPTNGPSSRRPAGAIYERHSHGERLRGVSESIGRPPDGPAPAQEPASEPGGGERSRSGGGEPDVLMPSRAELDALPAEKRLELLELRRQREAAERDHRAQERERRRQSLHQWFNSLGILVGVIVAGSGLVATALTLRAGQQDLRTARDSLRTAQEGQVTDRYIRATEQLGSGKPEVRLSAIYALERVASDSPRDTGTILDVLASYARIHDPAPGAHDADLPAQCPPDLSAALTVISRLPRTAGALHPLNLREVRCPGISLLKADLRGSDLYGANLTAATLNQADLRKANLTAANLAAAELKGATFTGADLGAAELSSTYLDGADLAGVDMTGASLAGATLAGTNLTGANLSRANLTGIEGMTAQQIRKIAKTDRHTKFGPLPTGD
ncbi:pentapeptide repeat-containing protein [Actinomadura soli]|uniref:Pentapeptide repeat-containing protein n=1 Tax=Actinomadura soli TaxID=2508997 RepID=A0A5C4JD54_9ACTN|nr:pentapeptide repeat-containing protein [Actinomadura soli]